MRRMILSALVLVLCASAADAGPLLNFIENRREARAARRGGCQTRPPQSFAPQSGSASYTLGGNCANGQCPIPQALPRQALPPAVLGK